jgi:hypothetical protein
MTTDPSNPTGVWNSGYVSVWHLKENPSVTNCGANYEVCNSKSSSYHGQMYGSMTSGDQVPGKIDGSLDFDRIDDRIEVGPIIGDSTAFTVSAWFKTTQGMPEMKIYGEGNTGNLQEVTFLSVNEPDVGNVEFLVRNASGTYGAVDYTPGTLGDGNWHQLVGVQRAKNDRELFVDGISRGTNSTDVGTVNLNTGNIGVINRVGLDWIFGGGIDEVRISSAARDACWIQTEYKSMNNPSAFYTDGAEEGGPVTAIGLNSFTAKGQGNSVLVEWETKTEISNLGFNLYRSTEKNGTYTKLNSSLIPGLLSSVAGKKYDFTDANVTKGKLYYYQLEDIDLKGKKTMHGPICVDWDGDGIPDDVDSDVGRPGSPSDNGDDSDGDSDSPGSRMVTQIEVHELKAYQTKDGILIKWQTGYEVNNLGFHVYREENGQLYRLTPELIAGTALLGGSGTFLTGRDYSWWDLSSLDPRPSTLGTVRYWLEDIDLNGTSTWHGPVMAEVSTEPLPEAMRPELLGEWGRSLQQKYEEFWRIEELKERLRQKPQSSNEVRVLRTEQLPSLRSPKSSLLSSGSVGLSPQSSLLGARMQQILAGRSAVKIYVNQEGWYRISQPELLAAGLSETVNPKYLQLYVDGREIPMRVIGEEDRKFDPQDAIEFYGVGLDTLSTDARVYWLTAAWRLGKRIQGMDGQGNPASSSSFPFTVERKDRSYYFAALKNGEENNFFGAPVRPSGPTNQLLTLRHVDPSPAGNAILEVRLQGVTTAYHQVRVSLNGAVVGEMGFGGQSQGLFSVEVSQSALEEGDNLVTLIALGGAQDVSIIDSIRLTYWHTYTAFENTLAFGATGGNQHTVGGFSNSNIHVMDVTDPDAPYECIGSVAPQGLEYGVTIGVSGVGQRVLFAFTEEKAKSPMGIAHNRPSRWSRFAPGYELVIIAHGDFLENMKPLQALRKAQRMRVALVDVEDLYDEFNYGIKSPQAIKDFLSFAKAKWWRKPKFVLLVGDGSFDPRNSLRLGNFDFMPAKLVDTEYMETASDDWFVDFNSDGLPDLAIGRLPVRTVGEAQTVVSKIINYEQSTEMNQVLLVADIGDTYDFEGAAEEVEALLPPTHLPAQKVYRGSYGSDALARAEVLNDINQGPLVVNFIGHGSQQIWRGNLLKSADAAGLTNSNRLSFFVIMTCLNGFFQDVYFESMAEALLKAGQGGAVAVWGSSSLTYPDQQSLMNQELIRLLFNGQSLRLGEATIRAKAATEDQDVRRSWILFGDPSMRLRP